MKPRIPIPPHDTPIVSIEDIDRLARDNRDRGNIDIQAMLDAGLTGGHGLEIGSGPGYVGLEWLKGTQSSTVTGLDVRQELIKLAERNAAEYGMQNRTRYLLTNLSERIPFPDNSFDVVFSNSTLYLWPDPVDIFQEIYRVIKPGGRCFVVDTRRDINFVVRQMLEATARSPEMKEGLRASLNAAYTPDEVREILKNAGLPGFRVDASSYSLSIVGQK